MSALNAVALNAASLNLAHVTTVEFPVVLAAFVAGVVVGAAGLAVLATRRR